MDVRIATIFHAVMFILAVIVLNSELVQGAADRLEVKEATKIVQVGESIEMLCTAPGKIDVCLFLIPGAKDEVRVVDSAQLISIPDTAIKIAYNGDGFDRGHCGLRIEKATENLNGVFKCSAFVPGESAKRTGSMNVTVARTPTSPELRILDNKINEFKEGDVLKATCVVKKGRPATNFTWYLGEEILQEGLKKPVFTTTTDDLLSTEQNLTRTIQASDDGKELRCVANHVGLNEQNKQAKKLLRVNFKPKSVQEPFKKFEMVEGEEGRVSIVVEANPKPVFIWKIGDELVTEGDSRGSYQVMRTMQKESNHQWETTLVISPLTKDDVNKEYRIKATNPYGDTEYEVMISTGPVPETSSIGTGTLIIVLIVIALVFLISCVILFARAKGRWCFSVGDDHGDSLPEKGASTGVQDPSEGTENPAVNHHASTEYISNSPDLKKEKPKEDTPV